MLSSILKTSNRNNQLNKINMKRFLSLSLLLLTTHYSFCQPSISEMNECDFFDYLKTIKSNNYNNENYKQLKEKETDKINLLKRLETYLVVFASDSVAPMYLDTINNVQIRTKSFLVQHSLYCAEYVKEYYDSLKTNKKNKARDAVQKGKEENIRFLLFDLCELNNSDNNNKVEKYLAEFEHPYTLEYLYYTFKETYFGNDAGMTLNYLPQFIKEQNLQKIAQRMDILDNRNYMYFEGYNSKPDLIKGFEMYHDNDFLVFLYPGMNQDRELTGGFKFTIITDYLKWRWIRIGNEKEDNILTYQSVSLLGSGYTPYIRYRNNFELADSLHNYDRPFASYLSIERAKNRTWKNGLVRHKGEFQVGAMGISQGRKIQAKLHEDVITRSQFVHGWDKQIANGGRLVIQANHKFDFLLLSNT